MRALSLIVLAAALAVVGCDNTTPVDNKPAPNASGTPSTAPTPGTGAPSPSTPSPTKPGSSP
jgi:hypothetical protein